MGFHFPSMVHVNQLIKRPFSNTNDVPKGIWQFMLKMMRIERFVIPVSYLNQSSFKELLSQAEEEFRFDYPIGPLTISLEKIRLSILFLT
ncbi:LOW QUALITY PROTEIN: Small auxin-up RNA [Parasponia andersonii]|uniref:Small auxin-up RNA n=1 Tax=Parasponia andersonii TaxID=3476 RepID=A0A2P5ARC2_PARAD|nr:LOW QUALITY PROTEIN: Small auxin-up RNA [Parasponia andersonii]